jgi:hypothetical protein
VLCFRWFAYNILDSGVNKNLTKTILSTLILVSATWKRSDISNFIVNKYLAKNIFNLILVNIAQNLIFITLALVNIKGKSSIRVDLP